MLYEAVVSLIGEVPAGFEPLVYVACILVLLWLLSSVFSILWSVLSWIGGSMFEDLSRLCGRCFSRSDLHFQSLYRLYSLIWCLGPMAVP